MEYIVSDRIFESLPSDEQKLWHSHAYEVDYSFKLRIVNVRSNFDDDEYIYNADKIRTLGESSCSGDNGETRARESCQDIRQVLVHMANR